MTECHAGQRIPLTVASFLLALIVSVIVALIYLTICTLLTWLQRKGEKKLASYGGEVR